MDNFTTNAAIVTAWAAIIAPAITAFIHSIKEYQISKMNHTIKVKLDLCENFSGTYFSYQSNQKDEFAARSLYRAALDLAAVCHKRSARRALFTLANEVKHHGVSENTDMLYERCIKLLVKEF